MDEEDSENSGIENNGFEEEESFERPIECTECKRPIGVHYTEILGPEITQVYMCNECPILRHRLHGTPHIQNIESQVAGETGLACGNCGTTLNAIRLGTPLGCSDCYDVFDDVILPEMLAARRIPSRNANSKKTASLHIGRMQGEMQEISPSLRLLALNEALNEMLKSEDYEQAAWLRDQIRALTEKKNEGTNEQQ